MTESNYEHGLRGHRVPMISPEKVERFAREIVVLLGISHKTIRNMDSFMDELWQKYSINIEIVSNDEWLDVANALCDPSRVTIAMPEKLYKQIVKKRRTKKDFKALHIFFHELGHLLLAHKPVLHQTDTPATKYEDSEWQADYFADVILETLGKYEYRQLSLF